MKLGLEGRTALVTGASKGIGMAIAEALAGEGARILAVSRRKPALLGLQRKIVSNGGRVEIFPADLSVPASARDCVRTAVRSFGGLDILINNVGGAIRYADFDDLKDSDWRNAYELNVMSMIRLVRCSLPYLKRSPAPRIINIASISGVEPGGFNPHYAAAKAAMINAGKFLANKFAKDGVLINTICPGTVFTAAWDDTVRASAEREGIPRARVLKRMLKSETAKIPLGRIGEGRDIASLVVFLASQESSWSTGSCFHINGGKLRAVS